MNAVRSDQLADIARTRAFGFEVPGWARYVAVDADGLVWCYSQRPVIYVGADGWLSDALGERYQCIGDLEVECEGWRHSLLADIDNCWSPVFNVRALDPPARTDPQAVWRVVFGIGVVIGAIVLARLVGWLP